MAEISPTWCKTIFIHSFESPVPLKTCTFHGHRINLLFAMGASVFFHRNHIKDFINVYFNKEDRNRLLGAVFNYLNNAVYLNVELLV